MQTFSRMDVLSIIQAKIGYFNLIILKQNLGDL